MVSGVIAPDQKVLWDRNHLICAGKDLWATPIRKYAIGNPRMNSKIHNELNLKLPYSPLLCVCLLLSFRAHQK